MITLRPPTQVCVPSQQVISISPADAPNEPKATKERIAKIFYNKIRLRLNILFSFVLEHHKTKRKDGNSKAFFNFSFQKLKIR